MSFKNVAIVSIKGNDYKIHFYYISKNDAICDATCFTNAKVSVKMCYKYFFFVLLLIFKG